MLLRCVVVVLDDEQPLHRLIDELRDLVERIVERLLA